MPAFSPPALADDGERFYVQRRPEPAGGTALSELSLVSLTAEAVTLDGERVAPGTEGTIVAVLADGLAYDVEFVAPVGVATVSAETVRPIGPRSAR